MIRVQSKILTIQIVSYFGGQDEFNVGNKEKVMKEETNLQSFL